MNPDDNVEMPNMPDITPAQIIAGISAVVGVLVSATVIDDNTAQLVVGLVATIVPLAWMIADALIRNARNKTLAAKIQAHSQARIAAQSQVK